MSFETLLQTNEHILAEGSVFELLRRSPKVTYDEHIFHAGLIYDGEFAAVLEGVYKSYIDAAVASGFAMSVSTATWRANHERVRASRFSGRAVNQDNVDFLRGIRDSYADNGMTILIKGDIGPRGDAYKPDEALSTETARTFHSRQIEDLAAGGVDYLQASTIPAVTEALGIALAMARTGFPYVISFMIDRSGCLLDGTMLSDAIAQIDDKVGDNSTHYGVNCVHPGILHQALDKNSGIEGRIISFHGNTSDLNAAELDGCEQLITEEPGNFAAAHKELLNDHDIKIIGGCCGTTPDHIRAIAGIL